MSGTNFCTKSVSNVVDANLVRNLYNIVNQNTSQSLSGPNGNMIVPSSDSDLSEDYDFNDVALKYISDMLMEEDMEDKVCNIQESAALQEAEKSFYDVLGEKYPPSPDNQVPNLKEGMIACEENCFLDGNVCTSSHGLWCPSWNSDGSEHNAGSLHHSPVDSASATLSHSSYSSSSYNGSVNDGLVGSPESNLNFCDVFSDSQSLMQYKKIVEEASRFLPGKHSSLVDIGNNSFLGKDIDSRIVSVKDVKSESYGSRGKKNPHHDDEDPEEGRSNKQSALYPESTVRSEMFDMVLLCSKGKNESAIREALQNGANKGNTNGSQSKVSNGRKSRGKKQGGKRNVVDLRTLLTLCAQAVAADDRRTANEFLKQIRQHADPTGDGMQRLAHYFGDGLEGRMAGSGTQIYRALISFPISAVDLLKAYQLYLATCPFRKISNFFSNRTIWNASQNASRLHIVDFGILYGFQWPSLIQRLSTRPGGPPKLRITGIDLPHPGFRPLQRVEETGHRLANYAESFNVPFEFHAIAQKWETLKTEDLDIREDEVLIVNCLYRFRNLLDETVLVNSPRNKVLSLIKEMKPHTFILGIVNGAYNAPFFITRFREALFHYSSVFDMLEANIPREIHERMLLEKMIFGKEAMNVIACEGAERVERPETYKQWHVRNLRAGFRQLPLMEEIMSIAKIRIKAYNKDFVIDEDSQWLLQGWKGRIAYALSSWA